MDGILIIDGKKVDLTIKSLQSWGVPYQIIKDSREAHRKTPFETTICIQSGLIAKKDPKTLFRLPGDVLFADKIFMFRKSAHIFFEDLIQNNGDVKTTADEHGLLSWRFETDVFGVGDEIFNIDFPNLLILPQKNNIPDIINNLKKFVGFKVVSESKCNNVCQKIISRDNMCCVLVNNKVVLFEYGEWYNMFNVNINVSDKIGVNIILKKNFRDNLSIRKFPIKVLPFEGFEHPEKSATAFKEIVMREFNFVFSKRV